MIAHGDFRVEYYHYTMCLQSATSLVGSHELFSMTTTANRAEAEAGVPTNEWTGALDVDVPVMHTEIGLGTTASSSLKIRESSVKQPPPNLYTWCRQDLI